MTDAGWTDERTEHLKEMHATGLSASHMAARLGGITRNAVCGKVHRLGLPGRPRSGRLTGTPRMPRARRPYARKAAPAERAPPSYVELEPEPELIESAIPLGQRCSLLELNDSKCRWPIGDVGTSDFFFCGGSPVEGLPYCRYHSRVAYQPAGARSISDQERQRRRMQALRNREAGLWV